MKSMLNRADFFYYGRYRFPLVYGWLVQHWAEREAWLHTEFPSITGALLILDGHFFLLKRDWKMMLEATRAAVLGKNDSYFRSFFATAGGWSERTKEAAASLLAASRPGVEDFRHLMRTLHIMESPWMALLPVGTALDGLAEEAIAALSVSREAIDAFTVTTQRTLVEQQQDDAREIGHLLASQGRNAAVERRIREHLEKFRWFGMMHFWGEPLSESTLLEQATHLVEAPKRIVPRVPRQLEWLRGVMSESTYWRQHLAETCAIASYAFVTSARAAALDRRFDHRAVFWMTPDEFYEFLESGTSPSSGVLKARERGYGLIPNDEHGSSVVVGGALDKYLRIFLGGPVPGISEVRGTVACRGVVSGRACRVVVPDDIRKIREGDILICPETTPDFMPAFHKIRGVVADMGGLTSHAAIVSRELGKPCIIGTKTATQVFKDGDSIELDADNGVARKI